MAHHGNGSNGRAEISVSADWRRWFPHADPYENQPDAIRRALAALDDNGYLSMEGACGTGKTVTALTGAITTLRDSDSSYNRIVVATPLKNQTEQFAEELATINQKRPTGTPPINGVVMVSRSDLHPYLREDTLQTPAASEQLQEMRERTAEIIARGSQVPLPGFSPGRKTVGDTWYDPYRAQHLCRLVRENTSGGPDITYDYDESESPGPDEKDAPTGEPARGLETAGVVAPYPVTPPMTTNYLSTDDSGSVEGVLDDTGAAGELDDGTSLEAGDMATVNLDGPFDPFFAGYFARDPEGDNSMPISFDDGHASVIRPNDLVRECVSAGVSPHLGMRYLAGIAQTVIGNYYHVFDPRTRHLTQGSLELFDEETILVVDEAHNLEQRGREIFSRTLAGHTIKTARNDIRGVIQLAATGHIQTLYRGKFNEEAIQPGDPSDITDEPRELAREVLADAGVSIHHLRVVHDLLTWLEERALPEAGMEALDDAYSFDYTPSTFSQMLERDAFTRTERPRKLVDEDVQLAAETATLALTPSESTGLDAFVDPSTRSDGDNTIATHDDGLSNALRATAIDCLREEPADRPIDSLVDTTNGVKWDMPGSADDETGEWSGMPLSLGGILGEFDTITEAVERVWAVMPMPRETQCTVVGSFLSTWLTNRTVAYHREFEAAFEPTPSADDWDSWTDVYTPKLSLRNTIPADELAEITTATGGGIFMSATLEPHDVFQAVSGLKAVAENHHRPLSTSTYGLTFPEANRASIIGGLPRYISKERGNPVVDPDLMTETRLTYARQLDRIARTHGNILVAMPNYEEASWLARYLTEVVDVEKPVLVDEPSSHEETQDLLDQFTADDDQYRILTTGLRGTVTEGVDYAGDDLHTAVVVGVPMINIKDPTMKAVKDAYGARFGEDNAFEYTFSIPAVRKARQALGRVIRSGDDVGARVLLDERYQPGVSRSVHQYLSPPEREEFQQVSDVPEALRMFWAHQTT